MEIAIHPLDDAVEIQVTGRLDNTWSEFFAQHLDQIIASGARDLRVDLSGVNFLSSAGIGVLVHYYKELRAIQGSFVVVRASPRVSAVLKQVGLYSVLCDGRTRVQKLDAPASRRVENDGVEYDIFDLGSADTLRCHCYGDPEPVFASAFEAGASRPLQASRLALGLGALGSSFEECRDQFGEFLALGDATACQPADATSAPDYFVCTDGGVADVQILYGLACEGSFRQLIRFEARRERGPLPLSQLVEQCLALNGGETAGLSIFAEVAGIVGTALRRPPVECDPGGRFHYPEVSKWLSFSPERTYTRTVALITGVASSRADPKLMGFLRPLASAGNLLGHFHAAIFSYRPMQRGVLQLEEAVKHVFETQTLLSVVHLVNDARPTIGAGQTEFERGACWVAEVSDVREVV